MTRHARVAIISEHASPASLLGGQDSGGQNVYVDELSRNLAALGYYVDVFSRRDGSRFPEVMEWSPGVRVIHLDAGPPEFVPKDHLWPCMPELRDELIRFMVRDGVRYDLLHGNFWMSGWVAVEIAEKLGLPAVQTFHALGMTKRRYQGSDDTSPPNRISVEQEIVRRLDQIIAQCARERDELLYDYAAPAERITLLPAGVNTDRFRPVDKRVARQRIGLEEDRPAIVYVGRLLPRKDIRNVVRALAELSNSMGNSDSAVDLSPQLLIVGGESPDPDPELTPEIGELKRLADNLGVSDQVMFTGRQDPDDLRYFYSATDVAVTTPWYEPFGFTPLEAMACGRPVIGSAVGGLTCTIDDGRTGFLVPPRDPVSLAARVNQLLSGPRLRDWMGQQARARVESRFTWSITARKVAEMYDRLISESRARRGTPLPGRSEVVSLGTDWDVENTLGRD